MAPSAQTTSSDVQELLKDAELAGEWILDPSRSTVSLKSKSAGIPVNGVFRQVTGTGSVSATGEVTGALVVAAASIDTKSARRDNHLRSADFFDVRNYPDITFTVAGIRPSGPGVTVTGTLNVRDRAKPLTFDGTAAVHCAREVSVDAKVKINRADFGLTWNFLGAVSTNAAVTVRAVFTRR